MQFKVPQFLDIEDKIFGPFTFKEFIYLVGGAGLCFVLYKLLGLVLGAIPILAVAALSVALARYRPNNKPFIDMIEAGFGYLTQSKLYIWKRRQAKIQQPDKIKTEEVIMNRDMVRLGGNKLRDLAWSLDILDINKHLDSK
ncbi:MAG TPA: PrgI family protein [Candidatus Paceibacterota bacterium]|nr:PrgI family protein [Candidatus Paceibacterota bacterium]